MDINLARTFLAIVETRSFQRAAERLHVTQTSVSARVRTLEDLLRRKLFVKPSKESNVISIGFSGVDPVFVAAAANAFAQAYVDVNLELKIEPAKQYADWFEGQARTLQADGDVIHQRAVGKIGPKSGQDHV
jgi:uncharacterized protein involved in exopolysaccharide biosynthesis